MWFNTPISATLTHEFAAAIDNNRSMPLLKKIHDSWSGLLVFLLVAVAAWYTLSLWLTYMEIQVWRHDAAYYLPSYDNKLRSEGRWVNYYLFEFLKALNPFFSAALHLLFLGLFVLVSSLRVSRSITFSTLVALLCISSTTLYIQLLWPVTTLPSFTILALATLVSRRIPAFVFFPIFGILFFGSMSNLYFFLPLLFIRDYLDPDTPAAYKLRSLVYHLLTPWIAGYLIGYLFAFAMVYLETGQTGIVLASWREPAPITGVASLYTNIGRAGQYFASDLVVYLNMLGWATGTIMLSLFFISSYQRRQFVHLLIPLLVMPAIYVSSIPYGINLSFRTSTGIWLGLVFLFLVVPDIKRWEKPVYAAVVVLVLALTSAYSQANLNWYKESTNFYLRELNDVIPGEPRDYQGLVFVSDQHKYPELEQRINAKLGLHPTVGILTMGTAPRWIAIARQAGFSRVILCTGRQKHELCNSAPDSVSTSAPDSPEGLYSASISPQGWLIIRLNNNLGTTSGTP